MTIFGFNTDVKLGDWIYHVQSEARQSDLLLQTLVFLKGQCVGKRAVSYAQKISEAGFSEQAMHELLKSQHKSVLDAIQQGQLDSVLGSASEIQDVEGDGLSVKWTNPAASSDGAALSVALQVLDSGRAASGAKVSVTSLSPGNAQLVMNAMADSSGNAEFSIPLTADMLRDNALMVRATYGEKSATRKFRFRK
jgi:hypothetical protein